MTDYNLSRNYHIREEQLDFLTKELVNEFSLTTDDEFYFNEYTKDIIRNYPETVRPLFSPLPYISYQIPWKEDALRNYKEIHKDVSILNDEQNILSQKIVDSFNFVESEKKRLFNRIDNLGNLTGDLNLISTEYNQSVVYIKDSFQSVEAMDKEFGADTIQKVSILTKEGIITLGESKSVDISREARVAEVSGNGTAGTEGMVRRITVPTNTNKEVEVFKFLDSFSSDYHKDVRSILDSRPDTIFEYQMVNVPESFKAERRYYDFEWTKGAKDNDRLRLKLVFDLGSIGPLNWISLIPYFAYRSNGRMIIHSIKTSTDGFEYEPIYQDRELLHQELSDAQSTSDIEDLFKGNTSPADAAYSGKGVWLFPQKQARYVEIVIDQDQSYNEILGHAVYYITPASDPDYRIYIPAPEELKEADVGEYTRIGASGNLVYHKEIETTPEGWRYAIGLRDVHFMRYEYTEKSLYTSKLYEIGGPISRVSLYVNEIIPDEYQEIIAQLNDWIVYEVSFDDLNWHRISPMHHEPVNDYFPPKIIEINGNLLDNDMSFELHKQYVKTEEEPTQVRFRITMRRPSGEDFLYTTPIVHDIALKIEKRQGGI